MLRLQGGGHLAEAALHEAMESPSATSRRLAAGLIKQGLLIIFPCNGGGPQRKNL